MNILDDLERLEQAATAGLHATGEASRDDIPYVGIGYTDEVYALDAADPHEPVATFERPEDAAFYAAARGALPALLRLWKASLAIKQADEYLNALEVAQFPGEEMAAAAKDCAKAYGEWLAALAALDEEAAP